MPELPEVQTIVNDLNKKVKGLTITDAWTDWPKYFRRSKGGFGGFKKEIKNKKILRIWRLGKNIIFEFEERKSPTIVIGAHYDGWSYSAQDNTISVYLMFKIIESCML